MKNDGLGEVYARARTHTALCFCKRGFCNACKFPKTVTLHIINTSYPTHMTELKGTSCIAQYVMKKTKLT